MIDADTRLSDSAAGAGKGAKGEHKGAYSATIPCEHHAKGSCSRGNKCRFSHKGSDSKPAGKGGKGKKTNNERDRCKKCGKITNPPQWAKSCLEAASAQVVLTSPPVSSSSVCSCEQCKLGKRGGSDGDLERCLVSRWIF